MSVSANGLVPITPPTVDPSLGVAPLVLSAAGLYSDGRKLQGQSDHLANLQLGVEDYENGWEATVLLNYTSERIRAVEDLSNGLPSIIEQLPLSLDFVLNADVTVGDGEYEVGLKVKNLLNDGYEATQSLSGTSLFIDDYDIGTSASVSVKRRF